MEASIERQRAVFEIDDDVPHVPSYDPLTNPKAVTRRTMSAEFLSIDDQINASYPSATQVETQARQLEARIPKIDGTQHLLPARYGQPVDMAKIKPNLTLTSLIAQGSAELAHFCGIDPGIRHRIDEEKEARALAAQSLAMRTERLRESNERAAKVREQQLISGINPMTGRYF